MLSVLVLLLSRCMVFLPASYATDRIYRYLEQNQYQLKSYSVMNGIFVDTKVRTP